MSKKNSKVKKRNARLHDLQREKEAKAEKAKAAEKREAKANLTGVKKVKAKSARIRKGAVVAGIKIKDSDTKRKVRSILEKRRVQKQATAMAIDEAVSAKRQKGKKAKSEGSKASNAMEE